MRALHKTLTEKGACRLLFMQAVFVQAAGSKFASCIRTFRGWSERWAVQQSCWGKSRGWAAGSGWASLMAAQTGWEFQKSRQPQVPGRDCAARFASAGNKMPLRHPDQLKDCLACFRERPDFLGFMLLRLKQYILCCKGSGCAGYSRAPSSGQRSLDEFLRAAK